MGDRDVKQVVFADVSGAPVSENKDHILTSRECEIMIPLCWIMMQFDVLAIVVKTRELRMLLTTCSRDEERRLHT